MKFKGRFALILFSMLFIALVSGIFCFYFMQFNIFSSVLITLGVSLIVGIIFYFLLKSKKELETELSIPVIGYIEKIKNGKKKKKEKIDLSDKVINNISSNSSIVEGYQRLWERIEKITNDNEEMKTFLVTSTKPGEGKTITSLNLSIVAAQNKYKTLYVNADFRSLMNRRLLGVRNFKGLAGYLRGHATIEEIIEKTNVNNLKMITSGTYALYPEQLLESNKLDKLFELLKTQFDIIIIDSTSLLDVEDALILAKKTDGCLFVVDSNITKAKQALIAKQKLVKANINIVGLIVNNAVRRENNFSKKSQKKIVKTIL